MNDIGTRRIEPDERQTRIIALFVARGGRRSVAVLPTVGIPNAVTGAAVVVGLFLIGQVSFGSQTQDIPLLILGPVTVIVLAVRNQGGRCPQPRPRRTTRVG